MSDDIDPKTWRTLSNVLALVLSELGESDSALRHLRGRAAQDGVTGGALKAALAVALRQSERGTGGANQWSSDTNMDVKFATYVALTEEEIARVCKDYEKKIGMIRKSHALEIQRIQHEHAQLLTNYDFSVQVCVECFMLDHDELSETLSSVVDCDRATANQIIERFERHGVLDCIRRTIQILSEIRSEKEN